MDKKILVFNNKTGIAEKMAPLLAGEGMEMSVASDVEQLRNALDRERFHLMLVDVELNDKGWDKGIELIAGLRKRSSIPLIVISDQCAETAKIMALEAGADDYVTTKCNLLELLARIKSQMRRYTQLVGMCSAAVSRASVKPSVSSVMMPSRSALPSILLVMPVMSILTSAVVKRLMASRSAMSRR